jgi:hypothetical protein
LNDNPIASVADQRLAIGALAALSGMFGSLPAGHLTIYKNYATTVGLALDSAADLEAWRAALGFGPANVALHAHSGSTWLSMSGEFCGVTISAHMHQLSLSFDAAVVSPAEDAERFRAGQLVEQRHQVEDDAEPALCVASLPVAWSAAVSA